MKEQKNIDRLFQERFKDFDVSPDPAVWNKIHSELHNNKKKRRVIPIWWRKRWIRSLMVIIPKTSLIPKQ